MDTIQNEILHLMSKILNSNFRFADLNNYLYEGHNVNNLGDEEILIRLQELCVLYGIK